MNSPETFLEVGRVQKAHGIRGEIYISLYAREAAWLDALLKLGSITLRSPEQSTLLRQLQIFSIRFHKGGLIVRSRDIPDRNEAELLRSWNLIIPSSLLQSQPGESIFLSEIEGFSVFFVQETDLHPNKIIGFSSNGAQDLLIIETPRGNFDIPFVNDFVKNMDFKKRELHLDLPKGLLGEDLGDEEESGKEKR